MIKLVNKYFPEITDIQTEKLIILHELFETYTEILKLLVKNIVDVKETIGIINTIDEF